MRTMSKGRASWQTRCESALRLSKCNTVIYSAASAPAIGRIGPSATPQVHRRLLHLAQDFDHPPF